MPDYAAYETTLRKRKAELESRLRRIEDELDAPQSADSAERAVETEDGQVLEGIGQAGLAELTAIDAALERARKGTFGTCVRCGNDISTARLDAVPHAALCEDCIRGK